MPGWRISASSLGTQPMGSLSVPQTIYVLRATIKLTGKAAICQGQHQLDKEGIDM